MAVSITLFQNSKTNENQPDYRASYKDEQGEWHNVGAIWKKQGKKGEYLSLSLELEEIDGYVQNQKGFTGQSSAPQSTAQSPRVAEQIHPDQKVIDDDIQDDVNSDDLPF